jgi:hypothetical protein
MPVKKSELVKAKEKLGESMKKTAVEAAAMSSSTPMSKAVKDGLTGSTSKKAALQTGYLVKATPEQVEKARKEGRLNEDIDPVLKSAMEGLKNPKKDVKFMGGIKLKVNKK